MPNYDQFKKAWNSMWNAERKKYTEQYKNDAQFQQFANQYSQEMKNTGTQWNVNQNLNTNTNQWTNTQQWVVNNQNQTNANGTNWQNQTNFSEQKKPETDKSVVAENFDQSRLTNDNAQVSVKEWTAAQTWMPDYEADSDARDNEIVNNLNAYINSNPEFFSDRATFNQNFHYSERNQRQKALLDSFWKGQEDRKKASSYSTGDSIVQGMNSWEITTDQMNYIKSMNPEAYREWQQKQEELVNKRIANYTVPADPVNTAELFNQLVEKLGLQQWDPYKIYENWYGMCEQLGVFALNSRLESKIAEIEQNANERTRALERITKEWAWRKAQNLINAEMAKASAIYDARNADLQNAYNALYNQRQQNLAIANQSATALQMQWAEDSRVFNNKLAWLGFAMQTAAFRTPEQQLQNQLNFQAASNELNLLNQSRLNDLNLYNTYATNKLKNQMEAEATDLNTTDENQLRNNLNNVLSQYYSSYWDIIKRSQAQVVDDVIAYAKKNNCSIGEALTKNFIEPLQNKPEFKNLVASKYPSPNSQQSWSYSIWEDGKLSVDVKWVWDLNLSSIQKEALLANKQTYPDSWMKWAGLRNNNPWNIKDTGFWNVLGTDSKWFAIFLTPEDWFDALVEKIQNIQRWWSKTYNSNMSLYDFFSKYAPSSDNNNPKAYAESVAKQLGTTANATVWSVDATAFAAAIARHDSWYDASTYWNFRNASTYSEVWVTTNTDTYNSNPYQWTMWTTSTWAEINSGWWITSLEKNFWSTQRMSDAERKELYESYGIDKQTYDKMEYNYARYTEKTEWLQALKDSLTRAEALLQWNKDNQWLHEWWADIETAENWYYKFWPFQWVTKASEWRAIFDELKNNEVLNKFLDLKKNNASFWAMSEWEWSIIWWATSQLKWNMTDANFEKTLEKLIQTYKDNIEKIDPNYFKTPNEIKTEEASVFWENSVMTWVNNNLSWAVSFIIW